MGIRFEPDGHVVLITIDRPEFHNCLDPEHNDALAAAFARYEADDELRCAVLTGAGEKSFSAGADLKALIPPFRDAVRAGDAPPWVIGGLTDGRLTKPTIAAVNGHALAGGMEMALACDIRLASPNASLGLAETKWAIIPGAGGTQRLPRTVGLSAAMEIILTGDPVDADTALRLGLVNRVLPLSELVPAALTLARTIASRGPLAVRAARAAILAGFSLPEKEAMALEYQLFLDVMRTEDAVEGPTAFAQKRPPVYQGPMKDARMPRRKRREPPAYDVVTPTPDEARLENIRQRQKRYHRVMVPCIILVAFGFFVPAPTPIRLIALAIAAFMPPIAAIVGNSG